MARNYTDDPTASTTLSGTYDSDVNSTLTVTSSAGFPAVPFYAAIKRGLADQQVVEVTGVAGTTWTVTHVSGSTPTHAAGSSIEHVVPAIHFNTVGAHIDATTAHGSGSAIVGKDQTVTLTGKTMSGASNTFSNIPQSAVTSLTTDLSGLRVKAYSAEASGSQTITTTLADIAGASVTITTTVANTVVTVIGTFDVSSSGASDTFTGILDVDGTSVSGQAITSQTGRATTSQAWAVTLTTAASHTLKLRGQKIGSANTVSTNQIHTRIVVTGAGI